jgi:hypothetical protein
MRCNWTPKQEAARHVSETGRFSIGGSGALGDVVAPLVVCRSVRMTGTISVFLCLIVLRVCQSETSPF